jgi:hypothetical protein
MFTIMSDIDRMFGTMDLLRNKMDRIFADPLMMVLVWLSGPADPEPICMKMATTLKLE